MVSNVVATEENYCTIDDVEVCEKGVHNVWTVDDDGGLLEFKESWCGEAFIAYYYCDSCGQDWVINSVQDQEAAWKLVKEHLIETPNS